MSNLYELQKQLHEILKRHPNLRIASEYPWNPELFQDVIFIIQDYVNGVYGDFSTEDLEIWLDRYNFHKWNKQLHS